VTWDCEMKIYMEYQKFSLSDKCKEKHDRNLA